MHSNSTALTRAHTANQRYYEERDLQHFWAKISVKQRSTAHPSLKYHSMLLLNRYYDACELQHFQERGDWDKPECFYLILKSDREASTSYR